MGIEPTCSINNYTTVLKTVRSTSYLDITIVLICR
jgi:hypothetical protein